MKKVLLSLTFGVSAIVSIISCKHEIPGGNEPAGGVPGNGGNTGGNTPQSTCSPDTVYFQQQVLPIFISNCALSGCHDAASHQDGIVLTSYSNILSTGDIEPGDPNDSEVYEMITEQDNDDRMPPAPRNRLTTEQIAAIKKWIQQGAKNNSCETSACDTSQVTFANTIKPIIINKCQGCHSGSGAGGGYDYTTYAGVKARVNDGKLLGAVNHLPGYSPMPKNGSKLSACEISQFKKWIDAGAPDN